MKLMHPLFSTPICFKENSIQVLTIENPVMFREVLFELIAQTESKEGRFVLSVKDQVLDCADHMNVIMDYAHLSAIDKKLQNKLLMKLIKDTQETMAEDTFHLIGQLQQYMGKLAAMVDYPVTYEQSENLTALLKAMEFRADLDDLPPHEMLFEYLDLNQQITKDQCFALVHAKAFFSVDELQQLYSMAHYKKWNLLLIESHIAGVRLESEQYRLYDMDLCELADS